MDAAWIDVWVGCGEKTVDAVMCIVDLMKRNSEIKILVGCTEIKQIVYETHNDSQYVKGVMLRRSSHGFHVSKAAKVIRAAVKKAIHTT